MKIPSTDKQLQDSKKTLAYTSGVLRMRIYFLKFLKPNLSKGNGGWILRYLFMVYLMTLSVAQT
jgi:hypothetical protein